MRVVVTGALGFVGGHVKRELESGGHEVVGFDSARAGNGASGRYFQGDATDPESVRQCLAGVKPDACVHLAAMAFVPAGWDDPGAMFRVNVSGAINFLKTFIEFSPAGVFLFASSSEVYGVEPGGGPLREDAPFNPQNIYAASKAAADTFTRLYAARRGARAIVARPCNHIGPGQDPRFVLPSFARQVAECARGKCGAVRVGNLDSERYFLDVRDVARAYRMLLEKEDTEGAYNVSSDRAHRIGDMLEMLCEFAGVRPVVESEPELMRPADRQPALDGARLFEHTGWRPRVPIERTVRDALADFLP